MPPERTGSSLAALFAAFLSCLTATIPQHAIAQAYKPEYRLSTAVGPAYPWGKGAAIWAQLIKERSAGRISIRHYPGASAVGGDPAREFAALRDGSVDLAVGSSLTWAAQVDALNVFALPFLVGDRKSLEALLHGDVGIMAMRAIAAAGVVPLAWGESDFREISTAQRPVRKPEDLAGLRIRSSGSLLLDDMLGALGAEPVRMKWLDAQNALLERGLDGQDTTVQAYVATQAHSLGQKQFTVWAAAADPLVFAVSRAAWDGWSDADREVVRLAAIEAATRESELARRAAAAAELAMARDLKGAGVVVTRLTPEERAALAAATRAVFEKWSAKAGADLVRRAQDAIAAARP